MKHRWRWLALVVAILVGVSVVLVVISSPRLVLPAADEVAEMRASLRESRAGLGEAVPEFVVPPKHVPVILELLRPEKYEPHPPIFPEVDELGEVVIRTRAGQEVRLRFFWAGKNPVVVTRDGVDHYWGRAVSGIDLSLAVLKAHHDDVKR